MEGQETLSVEQSGMLQDLKKVNAETRAAAKGQAVEELPVGAPAPVEAAPEATQEEEIKIDDQVFKSEKDALAYATEKLKREEQERLVLEAHSQGVREALQATRVPEVAAPPPVEDNFDEQFYANPKETLKKVKEEAKNELRAEWDAKDREEKAWQKFANQNPDLADSRGEVMRILQENWAVLGKMTDEDRAMKILAGKTRDYFHQIAEKLKPRTELRQTAAQVVSAGGAPRPSVTPTAKSNAPLTMAQQLKSLSKR